MILITAKSGIRNGIYTQRTPEYQEHTATVTAIIALGVANLDKQLSREGLYTEE